MVNQSVSLNEALQCAGNFIAALLPSLAGNNLQQAKETLEVVKGSLEQNTTGTNRAQPELTGEAHGRMSVGRSNDTLIDCWQAFEKWVSESDIKEFPYEIDHSQTKWAYNAWKAAWDHNLPSAEDVKGIMSPSEIRLKDDGKRPLDIFDTLWDFLDEHRNDEDHAIAASALSWIDNKYRQDFASWEEYKNHRENKDGFTFTPVTLTIALHAFTAGRNTYPKRESVLDKRIGIGGNHLASALSAAGIDVVKERTNFDYWKFLEIHGQPWADIYVAWKAIMDTRDNVIEGQS